MKIGETTLKFGLGRIEDERTDALVNAANKGLARGTGVCGALYAACKHGNVAGRDSLAEEVDKKFPKKENEHRCKPGDAVTTGAPGDKMNGQGVKHIIHAVPPDCKNKGENDSKEDLLKSTYKAILREAKQNKAKTIAIPLLGIGEFKYEPTSEAAKIAVKTVSDLLQKEEYRNIFKEVKFVVFRDAAGEKERNIKDYNAAFNAVTPLLTPPPPTAEAST